MTKDETDALLKSVSDNVGMKFQEYGAAIGEAVDKAVDAHLGGMAPHNRKNIHGGAVTVREPLPDILANRGKFFQTVHKAATDGGVKIKLAEALELYWKTKAPSGMNTVMSADGGFLPTAEIMAEIKADTYDTGGLLASCDVMPLGGNNDSLIWKELVNEDRSTAGAFGGIRAYRNSEGATVAFSGMKFREREIRVKDMMALVPVTNQLLGDATSLGAFIGNYTPAAFNDLADEEIYRGNGAGECLGVLDAACTLSVAKETNQAADTILFENIQKMFINFDPAKLAGAKFYINPHAQAQLWKMSLPVGTGGSAVYIPGGTIDKAPFGTLMGIPVVANHTLSKLGDKGDIMLANFKDYLVVDKGGIDGAESMHVLFATNEMMFRFVWRINGMPKPVATITPKHGNTGDKLSSFVTLAERA